ARLVPEVAPAIARPEVERDRPTLPVEPGEAEPPGAARGAAELLVKPPLGRVEEQARIRRRRPPGEVLFEELRQGRQDAYTVAEVPHVERPRVAEVPLVSPQADLARRLKRSAGPPPERKRRRGEASLIVGDQPKPCGGLAQALARARAVGDVVEPE